MNDKKKIGRPPGRADLSQPKRFVVIDKSIGDREAAETAKTAAAKLKEEGLFPRIYTERKCTVPGLEIFLTVVVGYERFKNENNIQHSDTAKDECETKKVLAPSFSASV